MSFISVAASASPSVGSVYVAPLQLRGALYIVISQSGKSPDLVRNAEIAKAAGAQWDWRAKRWYAPRPGMPELARWLPVAAPVPARLTAHLLGFPEERWPELFAQLGAQLRGEEIPSEPTLGEVARIIECAPKSKTKTWEVLPKGAAQQAS